MTSDEAVIKVINALELLNIPYMLVGSLSSSTYGIPRSSQDADVVVSFGGNENVRRLANQLGSEFRFDQQMSFEGVGGTHRHEAQVVDSPFKVEFFHLSDDEHDMERFRRKVRVTTRFGPAWLPTPEDVIVYKLRWARSKDRDDVRDVIAVQSDSLDWKYIYSWAEKHSTRDLLDQIRDEIPADN